MSLETQVTELVSSANALTGAINSKVSEINAAVAQGISDVDAKIRNGDGEYELYGSNIANQWVDIADLSNSATFTMYVLSTENSYVQPQEWVFVLHSAGGVVSSTRVDNYGVLHSHSNDLFFQVDLATKKLQVKKTLTTSRRFSIHLRVNLGVVTTVASQSFS